MSRAATRGVLLTWFVGLALGLGGCRPGPKVYEVEGTVTLDGKPLPKGDIQFIPEDQRLGPDAGKIEGGKFKFKAKGGKARVEIRATREVPGKKGPMGTEPLLEDIIPETYNAKSTLTADVGPGKTTFDFPLKSSK